MPKRSSKPRQDENRAAFDAIRRLTGEDEPEKPRDMPEPTEDTPPAKNPHAQALGRLGGKKGGRARAERLSARRRKQIARKAAKARWKPKDSK